MCTYNLTAFYDEREQIKHLEITWSRDREDVGLLDPVTGGVSSLEVDVDGGEACLHWVRLHPGSPQHVQAVKAGLKGAGCKGAAGAGIGGKAGVGGMAGIGGKAGIGSKFRIGGRAAAGQAGLEVDACLRKGEFLKTSNELRRGVGELVIQVYGPLQPGADCNPGCNGAVGILRAQWVWAAGRDGAAEVAGQGPELCAPRRTFPDREGRGKEERPKMAGPESPLEFGQPKVTTYLGSSLSTSVTTIAEARPVSPWLCTSLNTGREPFNTSQRIRVKLPSSFS